MSGDPEEAGGAAAPGEHPELLAAQASELLDRRRVGQARALLAGALREHPDHAGLLFESARADVLDERNASARGTLGQLLQQDPSHLPARWLLFHIEMDDGQLVQAEELVLGLLREMPASAQFLAGYSRLMLRSLHIEKARALADEALRQDPNDEDALRARTLCDIVERPGRTDSAALARLLAASPDDAYTLRLVAVALIHANRPYQALGLARELLRHHPDDPHLLGMVKALRLQTHWSLWPLWPMQRWGWYGSIGLWVAVIVLYQVLRRVAPDALGPVSTVVLVYVAYSWIWPPLLRRWLERE